jgi:hypothetical protein|tara:strand:+ start:108 stop:1178 length:1071 start_codon:yes stop_codon:yes gene_type:complete
MAYTTIDNPELYFQTKLYTGTGSSNAITLDGSENMQPDWVWIKCRDDSHNHQVFDSVRGVHKRMRTDTTGAETESSESLKSFDSNGFTVGTQANVNASASGDNSFVSWNWKAGTSFSNDASATSVGTIDSSGSTNQTAGFSIVSWTGTGSAGTVAHNLGSVPEWYIIKNRSDANNWAVYHQKSNANPEQYALYLDGTSSATDDSGLANDTAPTSTVFSLTNGNYGNQNTYNYIGYFFSEVKGYSRFGSYEGNGVASGGGPFIYLGFRPAWFLLKELGTDAWTLLDNKRLGYNKRNDMLFPDNSNVEYASDRIELVSNGVKIIDNDGSINQSGQTYIYMAFAESPFVNSKGIPNNAR